MAEIIQFGAIKRAPVRGQIQTGLAGPLNTFAAGPEGFYYVTSMIQEFGETGISIDVYYSFLGEITIISSEDGIVTWPFRAAEQMPRHNYWWVVAEEIKQVFLHRRNANVEQVSK